MINKEDLRIVFMGTPEFAVESLKVLVENNYNVVGVVTVPDRKSGRGQKIHYSAVKQYALDNNLKIFQPDKLKNQEFINELKELKADVQIIVAFRMLPEMVWNMPRFGSINLHASLLPQYRGAAPINWAVINGEKETGVTTFFLKHEIDTGDIILQDKIKIQESDNAGTVHDKLMTLGADLILKTVDDLCKGDIKEIPQDNVSIKNQELKNAPKIFKEDCKINWNDTCENIHNKIRGLSPYPCAWTELVNPNGKKLTFKVFETSIVNTKNQKQVTSNNKDSFQINCADGTLNILSLQVSGKKRVAVKDFLNGMKNINEYDIIG